MAKALIGYMNSDLRIPARLTAENTRLRARVAELEDLVLRLTQENDALAAAQAATLLDLDSRPCRRCSPRSRALRDRRSRRSLRVHAHPRCPRRRLGDPRRLPRLRLPGVRPPCDRERLPRSGRTSSPRATTRRCSAATSSTSRPARPGRDLRLLPADRPALRHQRRRLDQGLGRLRRHRPDSVGVLPQALFENEAMNCGERRTADGTRRFALIGVDAGPGRHPTHPSTSTSAADELLHRRRHRPRQPAHPVDRAGHHHTHTVACVDEADCRYAYSAGDSDGNFSIFDLRNLDHPVEVDSDPAAGRRPAVLVADRRPQVELRRRRLSAPTPGGAAPRCGTSRDPRQPRLITTTGAAGEGTDPAYEGYNDFIHHNSFRPERRQVQAGRRALVRERQRAAGDRGGLRADRLQPGRVVPGLARQAARRDGVGDRAAGQGRARRPRQLPAAAGHVLLGALVRLPPRAGSSRWATTAAGPS